MGAELAWIKEIARRVLTALPSEIRKPSIRARNLIQGLVMTTGDGTKHRFQLASANLAGLEGMRVPVDKADHVLWYNRFISCIIRSTLPRMQITLKNIALPTVTRACCQMPGS